MPPSASHANAASVRAPELELADRARTGDQQALVQLYRRHRQALYRHAWRMLGEEAAALDVVQEAFARAIPAMPQTAPGLNFKAWIYRITTNLCLRELNRRGRTRPAEDLEHLVTRQPFGGPQHRLVGQQLQAALARLPDRYRQILLLREVEELTYGELAEVLELSEGNVKVLLHRARARFAALVIAEQLLSDPDDAARTPCEELHELLRRRNGASQTRQRVERHVESCAVCRHAGPTPETWALLPPPPEVALPDAPSARPAGQGATMASTGAGATASAGAGTVATGSLVGWIVAGGLLLVGAAAGAIALARATDAGDADTKAQPSVASRAAASRPAARAAAAKHAPVKADTQHKERSGISDTRAVRPIKTEKARKVRRKGTARGERNPALAPPDRSRAPQAVDPESPPVD